MATKSESDERLRNALRSLPADLHPVFSRLRADYLDAAKRLVPNFRGGPAVEVVAELVRQGWHKSS